MLETFGMHKGGKEYRRLVAALERIWGNDLLRNGWLHREG